MHKTTFGVFLPNMFSNVDTSIIKIVSFISPGNVARTESAPIQEIK